MSRVAEALERWGVLVAFVLLVGWNAGFAENAELFRSPQNVRNLFNQNAATGVVAVGMTLVIVAGGIDLAVGSVMALAGAVALLCSNALLGAWAGADGTAAGWVEVASVLIGIAAGLGTGAACGAVHGVLVTVGRLPAFIATLGGLVAWRSVTLALADAGEIRSASNWFLRNLGTGGAPLGPAAWYADGRPIVATWNIMVFLAVAVAGQVLLARTRWGRHLVAVGGNELAARYAAVPVGAVRFVAFVLVGACAGAAGLMQSARMNSVSSSQLGLQMELDAIAAVVIGGTSMAGGRGRVWGTVLGVLILGIVNNMLVVADVSVHWQGFVKGVIIVGAVLVQRGRRP